MTIGVAMDKNSITYLFEDVNLYETKTFKFFTKVDNLCSKIENKDLESFFNYLGLVDDENLITDCLWCEGHFPFTFDIRVMKLDNQIFSLEIGKNSAGKSEYLDFSEPKYISNSISSKTIKEQMITIDYYFSCTNNKDAHHYFMKLAVAFGKENVDVTKIGQFPENSSLGHFMSEDYKKELRKLNDSYIDYKNSEKSYRHGLYVGAYDYLRRVYEKMIDYYLKKCSIVVEDNWGAKEKIKSIKHCFDKRIQEFLYPFYSALSAGVHIMSEEECKENYNELKAIIDIQLQFIKSEEELDSQIDKSKSVLETLNKKYSKK